jgi:macrolide transport system ATP-binding/permease protein
MSLFQWGRRATLLRALCGLGDNSRVTHGRLSGGEDQKVAIAHALHQGGPLMLADEPTASLDAQAADDVVAHRTVDTHTPGRLGGMLK